MLRDRLARLPALLTAPGLRMGVALVASGLAALDPARSASRLVGVLLALLALGRLRATGGPFRRFLVPASLVAVFALGASLKPQFSRADFQGYFTYIQSLAIDHDLDFTNQDERWGARPQPRTPVGRSPTNASIGPALLWSPFFLVADAYALTGNTLGFTRYETNGFSQPYYRSALVGTLVWATLGAWALGAVLARRLGGRIATLAVLGAVCGSTVLFFVFVQPGMAHGVSFALVGLLIYVADRIEREPSARNWALAGLGMGVLVLVRLQAALFALFFLPLVLRDLWRRKLKPAWLLTAAVVAFVAFVPQMLAWKAIYGHWLTVGTGLDAWAEQTEIEVRVLYDPGSWFDPRALHLWDVLFGTDRGFFSWSPAMLLGVLALPFAVRRFGPLALGGLLVFVATAWFNGSLGDPTAGDSFGGRRFDLVVAPAAIGLGAVLEACLHRPLVAPALGLGFLGLWNLGLIRIWSANEIPDAAPLERVAQLQVRQAHEAVADALSRIAGAGGRAAAHRLFVGEYLFWNSNHRGIIAIAEGDSPYLDGGWSAPVNRTGPPQYRSALYPKSCVRFPLMIAVGLRATITAKAPGRLEGQVMRVSLNGQAAAPGPLGGDWSETVVELPREWAVPGPNRLCLEFTEGIAKRGQEQLLAAQVRYIQLSSRSSTSPTPVWGFYRAERGR